MGSLATFQLFGAFFTATTGQVLYFGFDRVSGSAVFDDSGSGNNGELTKPRYSDQNQWDLWERSQAGVEVRRLLSQNLLL